MSANGSSQNYQRLVVVFTVGWIAYACTYFLRKPLGVIKSDMEQDLKYTKSELGMFDTALLLPYSLTQMYFGWIADKLGARRTYGICLIGAGISMLTFGSWSNFYVLFLMLFVNGAFQSLCWPSSQKGLDAWVADSERNRIFGYFGTSPPFGGLLGSAVAVYLQHHYGWRFVHILPSLMCIGMGGFVLFFFKQPSELGIEIAGKESSAKDKASLLNESAAHKTNYTFKEMWAISMVPEVSICLLTVKMLRYCFYAWLPMYLLQRLDYSKENAGLFSTMIEVGGILGSASVGWTLRTFFRNKALLCVTVETLLTALFLVVFIVTAEAGIFVNSVVMIIIGILNAAPTSLLSGSFPTELGEMDGKRAGSAIVGFCNGFGSIGTFAQGPIIGWITQNYGWSGMFYAIILITLIGTVACYRAHRIYEIKQRKSNNNIQLGNIVVGSSSASTA